VHGDVADIAALRDGGGLRRCPERHVIGDGRKRFDPLPYLVVAPSPYQPERR
jgi:hypothetical protein